MVKRTYLVKELRNRWKVNHKLKGNDSISDLKLQMVRMPTTIIYKQSWWFAVQLAEVYPAPHKFQNSAEGKRGNVVHCQLAQRNH